MGTFTRLSFLAVGRKPGGSIPSQADHALFMPIFFALAGLHADLTHLGDSTLIFLTIALILIASVGKVAGAFVGGALGGMSARESLALGCGMNARGSTEVIVASIGLSMGALSQDLFTMIVAMGIDVAKTRNAIAIAEGGPGMKCVISVKLTLLQRADDLVHDRKSGHQVQGDRSTSGHDREGRSALCQQRCADGRW
jgi:hypothetical protein